jgi:uncharacterized protein
MMPSRIEGQLACRPVASEREALDAVEQGDLKRLRALLLDDPRLTGARGEGDVSLVLRAQYAMRDDLVEAILAAGPELNVHDAAAVGDTDRLSELLDAEPQLVRALAADGFAPAHLAAFFRRPDALRLLLDRGADPGAAAANDTRVAPLHSAAAGGDVECVRLLLAAGADPNARQRGDFVPLHAAEAAGDREMAQLLLDNGAEPVQPD